MPEKRLSPKVLNSDKLNIGCGTDIKKGYVNLDLIKFKGVDVVWDIDQFPYPFSSETFSEIVMMHVLEHVTDVVKTVDELWRISKPGAIVRLEVPYFTGLNAVKDPTHKHFFAAATFDFFERGKLGKGNYFDESSKTNFKILKRRIVYSDNFLLRILNPFVNLNQKMYERFFCYLLPSQTLQIELKVIKNHEKQI
jgi:SAM-dependent methyltransferase